MSNMKKKFEKAKTRINVIGPLKAGKSTLEAMLLNPGVLMKTSFVHENPCTTFSTEILGSSSNYVSIYLDIKEKEIIINRMKDIVSIAIKEACDVAEREANFTKNKVQKVKNKFINNFYKKLQELGYLEIIRFFNVKKIEDIFSIDFDNLIMDLKILDESSKIDEIHPINTDLLWEKYFINFINDFKDKYKEWISKISILYTNFEEGCIFEDEGTLSIVKLYSNENFNKLANILYGTEESCGLIIERVYLEAPASKEEYVGKVYIDFPGVNQDVTSSQIVERRIAESHKEFFIFVGNCTEYELFLSSLSKSVNVEILRERIFCILNKFDLYTQQLLSDTNKIISFICEDNDTIVKYSDKIQEVGVDGLVAEEEVKRDYLKQHGDLVSKLKTKVVACAGIPNEHIIVTTRFKDIDVDTLNATKTDKNFLQLLSIIEDKSKSISQLIYINNLTKKNPVSILLNYELVDVQNLVEEFYDEYNSYLKGVWNDVINNEINSAKSYHWRTIDSTIWCRKNNYKGYCHVTNATTYLNYDKPIDFSLKSNSLSKARNILDILINDVGCDTNTNKILVNVNGNISDEDMVNLLNVIGNRLKFSKIVYFQDAFLTRVTGKLFNEYNLKKSLEIEKNITLNDFYKAFQEMFKCMIEYIERYDIEF